MLFVPALADIGAYSRARADAQIAADSAALAAVQEVATGGDPAAAATYYAAKNGSGIAKIEVAERWVIVSVRNETSLGTVRASGKAELKDYDDSDY